jgi:hypothetical protein
MSTTQIKRVLFEEASAFSDWRYSYMLVLRDGGEWDPAYDEVVIGMSPESILWDDYGIRSRSFPPAGPDTSPQPWFQASSRNDDGVVTLINPSMIDIIVPWNRLRTMGPGMINVGLSYRNTNGTRISLLSGRLPLVDTVI